MAVLTKARRPLVGRAPADSHPHVQVADRHRRALTAAWLDLLTRLAGDFHPRATAQFVGIASPQFVAALAAPEIPVAKKRTTSDDLAAILGTVATESGQTVGVGGSFSLVNDQAVTWAREHAGTLVSGVNDETKSLIAQVVARGQAGELSPAQITREVKPLIGLTPAQAQAALNFRDGLAHHQLTERYGQAAAGTLKNSYALSPWKGGKLDQARIDSLYHQYVARQVRHRAETIALTETIRAAEKGKRLAWQAKIDAGGADGMVVTREWSVTRDDRTCPQCIRLDGHKLRSRTSHPGAPVQVEEMGFFPGYLLGPPAHPRCRCVTTITMDPSDEPAPYVPAPEPEPEPAPAVELPPVLDETRVTELMGESNLKLQMRLKAATDPSERLAIQEALRRKVPAPPKKPPAKPAPVAPKPTPATTGRRWASPDDGKVTPDNVHAVRVARGSPMMPRGKWSDWERDTHKAARGYLSDQGPSGRLLTETLKGFQHDTGPASVKSLRRALDKEIRGEAQSGAASARARVFRRTLDGIDPNDVPTKLYRGMHIRGKPSTIAARYREGEPLDLGISSFSDRESVAKQKLAKQFASGGPGETSVQVIVEGRSKAIPLRNFASGPGYADESEWVTAGRYRITKVTSNDTDRSVTVHLAQETTP